MAAGAANSASELAAVGRHFAIEGAFLSAERYGSGHINATFVASYGAAGQRVRVVHQRLNRGVFPDPEAVMENIARVLDHLWHKLLAVELDDVQRRALTLVPARDGRVWWVDENGEVWRTYAFIEGATTFDQVISAQQAFATAAAFGTFQRLLLDLPGPRLHEVIRDFHHTPRRLAALRRALDADAANRAALARHEIEFASTHEDLAWGLLRLQERGTIGERVVHNDTKINNVMFDEATGAPLCVIDLDTVMPGLALSDFGDMVRSAAGTVAEDAPDARAMAVRPEIFGALAAGFLSALGELVTPAERDSLVLAGMVMSFECGVRFLTDFLNGDRYFRVHRPSHNLDRCRTQFALVRSLAEREDELRRLAETIAPGRLP